MREKLFSRKNRETDPFLKKIRSTMHRYAMAAPGDRIIAGVSGGADSVCLLISLWYLSETVPFILHAIHVHHGLRESADLDEKYVRHLCAELGVPLEIVRVDASGYASEQKIGIEEAARILRYESFERECRRWESSESGPACKVAVAHHLDDQAETVLFHLCRGSSVTGLGGMRPVNGKIIRPLIDVRRNEIESWLTDLHISWRTDETNADTRYARNLIRQKVMPLLENVNSGAARHIARTARESAEVDRYLKMQTEKAAARCTIRKGQLSVPALLREDPLIQKRIVYMNLSEAAGHRKDLEQKHVEEILRLCAGTGSASMDLPYGIEVSRKYGTLCFGKSLPERPSYPLDADEYSVRILPFSGDMSGIPVKKYTKWLDYDKMTSAVVFRTRRAGDRIALSEESTKSLGRCMIDRKVPKEIRDRIVLPVLEPGQVLWIPGYRISAVFRVSQTTRQVLEIRWDAAESAASKRRGR